MPSTISSSVCRLLPSSTVITPSLPTFSIASEMILPISLSALAEIAPTWAISLLVVQALEIFFSSSTTAMTDLSMPRLRSIGFMPAATNFIPSLTIDCARTVAVVVPSPATSEVLDATSFTICAPMFSNLSLSSISLATDTPSLVDICLLLNGLVLLCDDAHDVVFTHHEVLGAFDFHGLPGELAEQDAVADFDIERAHLAVFEDLAFADGDDFALVGLLRDVVGNDDSACGFALLIETLHHNAVVQGTDFHHDI